MTRRYVRVLDDGRVAIPTSIEFLLTIDELAAGVVAACTAESGSDGSRFNGRLRYLHQAGESYWDEADRDRAAQIAGSVGRGRVIGAIRRQLLAHGASWSDDHLLGHTFPVDVARTRAGELWPDLDPHVGPFGGSASTSGSDR